MKCSVKECEKEAWQKGLCTMHYSRLRRHGDLEASRPKDWGARRKHELYDAWRELVRKKEKSRSEAWEDFWVFVKDVGARPSADHVLSRFEEEKPFGPDNFFWREKIFIKESDESTREYRRRYMRDYSALHPERIKKYDMKRSFGMAEGEFEKMLEAQNGLCAICGQPETVLDSKKQLRSLSVDHDHATGKVRALLCTRCNQGLGQFRDNPDLMRKGAAYVEAHRG